MRAEIRRFVDSQRHITRIASISITLGIVASGLALWIALHDSPHWRTSLAGALISLGLGLALRWHHHRGIQRAEREGPGPVLRESLPVLQARARFVRTASRPLIACSIAMVLFGALIRGLDALGWTSMVLGCAIAGMLVLLPWLLERSLQSIRSQLNAIDLADAHTIRPDSSGPNGEANS